METSEYFGADREPGGMCRARSVRVNDLEFHTLRRLPLKQLLNPVQDGQ
jgi:hypothetical protein